MMLVSSTWPGAGNSMTASAPRSWLKPEYVWILLGSIAVQTVFLLLLPGSFRTGESPDYTTFYAPFARHLVDGQGFVFNGVLPDRYPPGFPMYLAAHFVVAAKLHISPLTLITITNVLVMAFTCVLICCIAERMFSGRIGVLSAVLWGTYPFALWLVIEPSSEIPFILLLCLSVCFVQRSLESAGSAQFALAGLLTGVASLIRPVAVFVPLVFGAVILASHSRPLAK